MQESLPWMPGWIILVIALVISCVVAAVLNFAIEKVAYRPLRNSPKLAPLITAIGMSHPAADAGHDHLEAELQALSHLVAAARRSRSAAP